MLEFFYYFALVVYSLALIYITIYCILQFQLLYYYQRGQGVQPICDSDEENYPLVTVQLPVYNELYVVERLIDSVAEFDYPKDRLEIRVLDDSTDETKEIIAKKVAEYKAKGFDIVHALREGREGYKAGALKHDMQFAKGEFLAIFDADFLPNRDFLKRTLPHFQHPKTGVVQTRWEHINEDYSIITRLQALQLNVHFTVEQSGRQAADVLLQFNGTAGVWRRSCIEDAGGWEADTLTEDLDLSIRAQLRGWKICYLEAVGSPAELPAEMNGLKSQQFRWMKGGAETAKKMLPAVWRSSLGLKQKVQATGHLLASTIFVFVFLAGVFSVPVLFAINALGIETKLYSFFLIGWLSIISIYYAANVQAELNDERWGKKLLKFVVLFPLFLALSMGLSLHNTLAVLQGYFGKKSPFVRTPKFAIQEINDSFKEMKYRQYKVNWTTIFEGVLALYFVAGVVMGIQTGNNTFILFHGLLALGFGTIFYYTLRHLRLK